MKNPCVTIAFLGVCLGTTSLTYGQQVMQMSAEQASTSHGDEEKDVIGHRLLKRIEDFYVLQDEAQGIADDIRARHEQNTYADLTDAQQFARQLTLDLRNSSSSRWAESASAAVLSDRIKTNFGSRSLISPVTRQPSMVSFMRFRQRRKVDLPHPEGPIIAIT